jgi:HEAT repeat protein
VLKRLESAQTAAEARPIVEELIRELRAGKLFGEEARIARLTRRFWEDSAKQTELHTRLWELYRLIAPAVVAMDPPLAETLFVQVPMNWLSSGDSEQRERAIQVLTQIWEIFWGEEQSAVFLRALPPALARAAAWNDEDFEVIVSFLADQVTLSSERHLPDSLPQAFVERLCRYQGPHVWKLPEILALDTTASGTQNLVTFALRPPPLPPEQAAWINHQRWRELFLEKLENRRLTLEQKRQIVALLTDPELRDAVFRLVRTWRHREEPLPPSPPEVLSILEEWAVQEGNCAEAVRLLAAAGSEGLTRLLQMVMENQRDRDAPIRNPRPCEWDCWSVLFEHADAIVNRIEAAYQKDPAPSLLRLLARAGQWESVIKALTSSNISLRKEAAFLLALALAPEENELARTGDTGHGQLLVASWEKRAELRSRALEVLRQALYDEDAEVQREVMRALLHLGDETALPALLSALRTENENRFQTFLSGLQPVLTDSLARALANTAQKDSSEAVRRRAVALLGRAKQGSWQVVVEPMLRDLLKDADLEVRRAAAEYFATVPAREDTTTAALLGATQDANEYVRHASAMALSLARGWTPELVARLEDRLKAGDSDDNVARGLEGAYLHALRQEPGSADRLLAIILERKGLARWRKALAEGPPADSDAARALLERLTARPTKEWAPMPPKVGLQHPQRMIEFFTRAEEDPSPLVLIGRLVPRPMLDPWLIRRALDDPELSLEHRLWLIHETLEIPGDSREGVWRLLMQALRKEEGGEMTLALLGRWGFAGVRRLVEELWNEPKTLQRSARYLRQQEELGKRRAATGMTSGPYLPRPSVEDLPWIETTLARLEPGARDPRLEPLVELLSLRELGHHKQAVFQTRIPDLLLRHLTDPVECRAVAEVIGSLFGRGVLPQCQKTKRASAWLDGHKRKESSGNIPGGD